MDRAAIVARVIFFAVFAMNLTCALQFVIDPAAFASAYELEGAPGRAAVQGIGVAFLMWNATYPLFIFRPYEHMPLGAIILIQQTIGLLGELFILFSLPETHVTLAASIQRFVIYDGIGLVAMLASYIVLGRVIKRAYTIE